MQSIKVHSVTGDVRPVNAISVWDASSTGKRPVDSIPVWDDTNDGDKPLNAIQVKLVGDEPSAIKVWFKYSEGPGPGPSDLVGPKTIRFEFLDEGVNPLEDSTAPDKYTWTHVKDNIYDLHIDYDDWGLKLDPDTGSNRGTLQLVKTLDSKYYFSNKNFNVLDVNCEGVRNVEQLFGGTSFTGLQNILSIRNTSSVTNFKRFLSMGSRVASFTSIPLFDTSSAVDVTDMCNNARNVTTGALALYTQMSTQANPPTNHSNAFKNCGSNTPTGIAELAQIPQDWGGTKS